MMEDELTEALDLVVNFVSGNCLASEFKAQLDCKVSLFTLLNEDPDLPWYDAVADAGGVYDFVLRQDLRRLDGLQKTQMALSGFLERRGMSPSRTTRWSDWLDHSVCTDTRRTERGQRIAGDRFADWEYHTINSFEELCPYSLDDIPRQSLGMVASAFSYVGYAWHYGMRTPIPNLHTHLARSLPIFDEYFFGEWRNDYTQGSGDELSGKSAARHNLSWFDELNNALFFSLMLNDFSSTRHYIDYAHLENSPNAFPPYDATDWSREDELYLVLLSRFVCQRPANDDDTLRTQVLASRRARPKFLLACLQSIEANDSKQFAITFRKYMSYFRRTERNPHFMHLAVSRHGSIIWNIAAHCGIDRPSLQDDVRDLLVTPESLGISVSPPGDRAS